MNQIIFNGSFLPADEKIAGVANRGLRYGDGLFETMKIVNGKLMLDELHRERLFYGLDLMKFNIPSDFKWEKIMDEVSGLARKNNCVDLARIRLMIFRDNEPLHEGGRGKMNYTIEAMPLDQGYLVFNEKGLTIGLHPEIRKSCDKFSNLKSSNYLPYTMAAGLANEKGWDDCIVLNAQGRIADSSVANVFLVTNDSLITPALSEGCVAGVMRKYILKQLKRKGYNIIESAVTPGELGIADEVFLTNALYGIRWVTRFGKKVYASKTTSSLHRDFVM